VGEEAGDVGGTRLRVGREGVRRPRLTPRERPRSIETDWLRERCEGRARVCPRTGDRSSL
jgi:hypothetical protein